MPLTNRQRCLRSRPQGLGERNNFDFVEKDVPELKDREVLSPIGRFAETATPRQPGTASTQRAVSGQLPITRLSGSWSF
ncbi:MAG: hypothetical protein ABI386_09455 [Rhodanobacter sp.]